MPFASRSVWRAPTWLLPAIVAACPAGCRDRADTAIRVGGSPPRPPLEIRFLPAEGLRARAGEVSCGVPDGRDHAYDPGTGVFHVHFRTRNLTRSAFEVAARADGPARPVAFRLTGVPAGYGCLGHPLTLSVGGRRYALDASCASQYHLAEPAGPALVQSRRDGDAVIVEFTEAGQALLQPGVQVSLEVDTGW